MPGRCACTVQFTEKTLQKRLTKGGAAGIIIHVAGHELNMWGISSAGRALAWHARGQRFDPAILHHNAHIRTQCAAHQDVFRDDSRKARRLNAYGPFYYAQFESSLKVWHCIYPISHNASVSVQIRASYPFQPGDPVLKLSRSSRILSISLSKHETTSDFKRYCFIPGSA